MRDNPLFLRTMLGIVLLFYIFLTHVSYDLKMNNIKLSKEKAILEGELKSLRYELKQCKFMYSKC
jgi:hypothetical protein